MGSAGAEKSVAERGARIALDAAMNSAGAANPSGIMETAPLNALAFREMGEFASTSERQLNAPHHAVATAGDPFSALDVAHATPPLTWIHAGGHHAEAGYLDPALGWIGIRADAAGNGIHAALVPASAEAAQVLGSHVAGLNAYLTEHHREPATVTMGAPQDGREGLGNGSRDGSSARQQDRRTGETRTEERALAGISPRGAVDAAGTTVARAPTLAGKHISVMA
jgi:hypothetical protein